MLNPHQTTLILVDVQGNLARAMPESQHLIQNIQRCIKAAQVLEIPIIWIEQYPEGLGETIPELKQLFPEQLPLIKTTFGCMSNPRISDALTQCGRTQLLVCGIETHVCVYQSVIQMLEAGYEVELITDAVGSRDPTNKQLAIAKMEAKGAGLSSTEMWIFEATKDAKSPFFKEILKIVK